ncbi:hypothetical protein RCL_jg1902.t1 [Rhizophagus clarus]|uniref:Uncharacterized protein n=1 Tax=Rhizophagus clarus TaxID=94130 RepID=A0A8H3M462_9GLOM|nr:hypothetical protein RCL_jg1902.t1 [Rhizophagus clarus]
MYLKKIIKKWKRKNDLRKFVVSANTLLVNEIETTSSIATTPVNINFPKIPSVNSVIIIKVLESAKESEKESERGLEKESKRGLEKESERGLEKESERGLEKGLEEESEKEHQLNNNNLCIAKKNLNKLINATSNPLSLSEKHVKLIHRKEISKCNDQLISCKILICESLVDSLDCALSTDKTEATDDDDDTIDSDNTI